MYHSPTDVNESVISGVMTVSDPPAAVDRPADHKKPLALRILDISDSEHIQVTPTGLTKLLIISPFILSGSSYWTEVCCAALSSSEG